MPEPFNRLGWPIGLSSMEILWAWLEVRIERERSRCPCPLLSGVRQRPLGLIYVFSPGSVRREAALGPLRAAFEPQSPEFGLGGSSPRAPWGSVGVGRLSCVTLSLVFATRGAELTTLASMARVWRLVSSLTGTSEWNLGPSSADGVGIALMWHSTAP